MAKQTKKKQGKEPVKLTQGLQLQEWLKAQPKSYQSKVWSERNKKTKEQ